MVNILDLVKGQLGDAAMGKVGELVGLNGSETSSALGSILPAVLGGVMQKGSTEAGASGILDFMKTNEIGGGMFDNVLGLLGDGNKSSSLMKVGGLVLPFLLGGKKAGFMNLITKATGLGGGKASSLISIAAPMVLGMIGKQLKGGGASGLMSLLSGQKDHVKNALPAGMGDMLGFAGAKIPSTSSSTTSTGNASGGGLMKWLLPLLAVLAGVWYFTKDGCAAGTSNADNTEETVMETADGSAATTTTTTGTSASGTSESMTAADKAAAAASGAANQVADGATDAAAAAGSAMDNASFSIDAKGNLLDASGKTIAAAGSFKEVDGYYVDANGNKLGKVFQKIKDAVGAAGEKTKEFFQTKFKDLLKPKAEGATAAAPAYALSKMEFDPESQRISYYSKPEFEGLAAALKASGDSKISVNVYTADGKNKIENKTRSTMRAQQIVSMLKVLGVDAKQLKANGKGQSNAAKAAANVIDISVD